MIPLDIQEVFGVASLPSSSRNRPPAGRGLEQDSTRTDVEDRFTIPVEMSVLPELDGNKTGIPFSLSVPAACFSHERYQKNNAGNQKEDAADQRERVPVLQTGQKKENGADDENDPACNLISGLAF